MNRPHPPLSEPKPLRSTVMVKPEKVWALSADERDAIRLYFDKEASSTDFYFFEDCEVVRKVLKIGNAE